MAVESITLRLSGERTMHCSGCARAIKFALECLPGVQQVEANHRTQHIDLAFDTQALDLEQVRRQLDWIGGYQVAEVEVPSFGA